MVKRERMVMTQFHLHRQLLQKLREYAFEHDVSVAQVIRIAVMNYLNISYKSPVFQIPLISRFNKVEASLNSLELIK